MVIPMSKHSPQIPPELWTCDLLEEDFLHEVRCAECGKCGMADKVFQQDLEEFVVAVFVHYGAPKHEAEIIASNLVRADLRGIASHGVARLGRYISGIKAGYIRPGIEFGVEEPVPAIGVIDARNGVGQVVSDKAMQMAIDKAKVNGVGLVTVKNSNHYGIAGYWVQKALEHKMLGISMTNAGPLVIPTHGSRALLGTNPIALGVPTASGSPILIDFATSVVPRGKLEVYDRNRKQMPVGWTVDDKGYDCQNPGLVLKNLLDRVGGGILPLGGRGEEFGGHKGFCLAIMVDLLCGVLSGSAYGHDVHNLKREVPAGEIAAPRVGHFFMVLDIEKFMPLAEFEARAQGFVDMVRSNPKALDQEQVFLPGEKEEERTRLHTTHGIPLSTVVYNTLRKIAADIGLEPPPSVAERSLTTVRKDGGDNG
jgi:L-2-hydroxycarboxylate dehydrogenase (NAD+)